MPRISNSVYQKKYKIADFSKWLKGKMASEQITQVELAEKLNISQPALSQKIATGHFTLKDLLTIFEVTKADAEEIGKLMEVR